MPTEKKNISPAKKSPKKPSSRNDTKIIVAEGAQMADKKDVPNESLITKAVQDISDILGRTVKSAQVEVGEYILREFYEDDIELYRSKNPTKDVSLNALLEKCDTFELPVKKTFLQNSISVACVIKELGKGNNEFLSLPPSHKVALLPVEDQERLKVLSKRAAEEKMTVRQLREEVKAERLRTKGTSRAGRPPTPEVEKAVSVVLKALTRGASKISFKKDDVRAVKPENADAVKENVKNIISGLENLLKSLEEEYPAEGTQ
jgi:hypothetical protein